MPADSLSSQSHAGEAPGSIRKRLEEEEEEEEEVVVVQTVWNVTAAPHPIARPMPCRLGQRQKLCAPNAALGRAAMLPH